jgi:hypothetical protein
MSEGGDRIDRAARKSDLIHAISKVGYGCHLRHRRGATNSESAAMVLRSDLLSQAG